MGTLDERRALAAARTGRCRFCGRGFGADEVYFLGFTASDRAAAACARCEHRLARIVLSGAPTGGTGEAALREGRGEPAYIVAGDHFIETAETPWKAADRAWFEAHPDRSHRARAPFPGESRRADFVLVRQVELGARLRLNCLGPMPRGSPPLRGGHGRSLDQEGVPF